MGDLSLESVKGMPLMLPDAAAPTASSPSCLLPDITARLDETLSLLHTHIARLSRLVQERLPCFCGSLLQKFLGCEISADTWLLADMAFDLMSPKHVLLGPGATLHGMRPCWCSNT